MVLQLTFPIEHACLRMTRLLHQCILKRLVSPPAAQLRSWAHGVLSVSSGREPVQHAHVAMAQANPDKVSLVCLCFNAVRCPPDRGVDQSQSWGSVLKCSVPTKNAAAKFPIMGGGLAVLRVV